MYHHEDAEKENVPPLQAFPLLLSETLRERVAVGIALFLVKDLALRQLLSLTCAMAYPPAGGDHITLTGSLTFSNLNISQNGNDTLISAGTDLLAILKYTQSSTITSAILT